MIFLCTQTHGSFSSFDFEINFGIILATLGCGVSSVQRSSLIDNFNRLQPLILKRGDVTLYTQLTLVARDCTT
jgi:hypothetical protein